MILLVFIETLDNMHKFCAWQHSEEAGWTGDFGI